MTSAPNICLSYVIGEVVVQRYNYQGVRNYPFQLRVATTTVFEKYYKKVMFREFPITLLAPNAYGGVWGPCLPVAR